MSKVKQGLFLLLILLLVENLNAQEPPYKKWNVILSYNLSASNIKEEVLIPKVHRGVINNFSFLMEQNKSNFNSLMINLGYGHLKTKLESEKVTLNGSVNLIYIQGYSLIKKEKIEYYFGYNAGYLWNIMNYPVWDESRVYWSSSFTVGPYNRFVIKYPDHQFIFTWDVSIIGLLSRPEEQRLYAQENASFFNIIKTTNSHYEAEIINHLMISNLLVEYRMLLPKNRNFSFIYSVFFSKTERANQPPLYMYRNNFGMAYGF